MARIDISERLDNVFLPLATAIIALAVGVGLNVTATVSGESPLSIPLPKYLKGDLKGFRGRGKKFPENYYLLIPNLLLFSL